ncbi:GRB2-associated-binding protein 3 isoform X2 [Choloepus didactylus]|uniref:GRB2-associated-binding protein 3 isoform X2 n=1 Tax=Choloepus didactylus TaxID=27675 RepID=UPI00189D0C4C|nr:GRB2-associated-binding protein 3 isoform X2 [Choloepus didactylus]
MDTIQTDHCNFIGVNSGAKEVKLAITQSGLFYCAWRKRWFVLRRGRMSGNPDVLEYYRSKHSSKPIRVIDLSECAVWKHTGPGFIRKEFQNNFVFIVKTTARTFYLVAKTEEEMQVWVHSISQICNLGHSEDGTDSVESLSCTPSSLQPSPASSFPTAQAAGSSLPRDDPSANTLATEETRSESELLFLPDYLVLSNCETGRLHHASLPTRCDSWSNSDRSLEQTSSDDVFVDCLPSLPSSNLVYPSRLGDGSQEAPSTRSQATLIRSREINGPSRDHLSPSPLLETYLNSTIQVDKNQGSLSCVVKELNVMSSTPPPRPPKPSHLSERRQEQQQLLWSGPGSTKNPECTMVPRRISLSGLDNMRTWKADVEGQSLRHRDKRLSLNLPCRFSPVCPTTSASAEDSYVPMGPHATASGIGPHCNTDDYIPMSSGSISSPLSELPADLEPPPVNRDLKPQRKSRPPPLDLRNLSTIREHASLTRTLTVPCNRTSFLSPERNGINSARLFANPVSREEEESYFQMQEHRQASSLSSAAFTWTKRISLDYLALDFNNSASPAPVQKKLFLSEEQRVDYVQVDEQKTQALQSTKQMWTDERQSKEIPPGQGLCSAGGGSEGVKLGRPEGRKAESAGRSAVLGEGGAPKSSTRLSCEDTVTRWVGATGQATYCSTQTG